MKKFLFVLSLLAFFANEAVAQTAQGDNMMNAAKQKY